MPNPNDPAKDALTPNELEQEAGEALPAREAMTTIDVSGVDNFAAPINEATAANINSSDSYAIADADQVVILNQTDVDDGTTTDTVLNDSGAERAASHPRQVRAGAHRRALVDEAADVTAACERTCQLREAVAPLP